LNFEKDIFLSYAHIDNEALIEGGKGWISEFHRALEVRLAQLLGEKPNIWRDTSLDGNHRFAEEIVSQFDKIAILVSVISPRYVNSDWCVKEVQEFFKASENNMGVFINNKARVFKVIKTPVQLTQHPSEIQGLLGYDFFQVDGETKRVKEFSAIFGPESQQAYWSKLDDIAHDISELLKEIKGSDQTKIKQLGPTVYLADTSFDKKEERDKIKRWLKEGGFNVLPNKSMSEIADEYKREVQELLAECELSIHIIGNNYGLVLEGTDESKIVLQNREAGKISKEKGLKRIIWSAPNNQPSDERQKAFLEELNINSEAQIGADFIISNIEDLKFAIQDKFKEEKEKAEEEVEKEQESEVKQVYLICEEGDLDSIVELEDYLFNQGLDVILPAFEGDQTELRLDHQENLKSCHAVIIYYGAGSELWVRSKTRDFLKIAGYGRSKPLNSKTVIIAGEETPQKKRFRSHDLEVIDMLSGFDANLLRNTINQITQ